MRARLILVVGAAVLGVMVWAVPVSAGGPNGIGVVAVVNGTPTGSLELTRTCSGAGAPVPATSAPFTTSLSPAIPTATFTLNPGTCTVAVTQAGGMTASFGCTTPSPLGSGINCGAGNDSVTSLTLRGDLATITVTFNPAPTTPAAAPEAVVAPPRTTG